MKSILLLLLTFSSIYGLAQEVPNSAYDYESGQVVSFNATEKVGMGICILAAGALAGINKPGAIPTKAGRNFWNITAGIVFVAGVTVTVIGARQRKKGPKYR